MRQLKETRHLGVLNLFQEQDGSVWFTVAGSPAAVAEAVRRGDGTVPMNVMAEWVEEAAQRFVGAWKGYRHSSRPGGAGR